MLMQEFHDLRFLGPLDLVFLLVLEIVLNRVTQIGQTFCPGSSFAANASSSAGRTFCLISFSVTA